MDKDSQHGFISQVNIGKIGKAEGTLRSYLVECGQSLSIIVTDVDLRIEER